MPLCKKNLPGGAAARLIRSTLQLTFDVEYGRLFFAAERVDRPDDVLADVVHLGATQLQLVLATRVLGHVLQARVQHHVLEVPAAQFAQRKHAVNPLQKKNTKVRKSCSVTVLVCRCETWRSGAK